jgi:hypothetical protein
MTEDTRRQSPLAGAPTWVRVLQAAIIGLVAGLALNAIFSMVVLSGETAGDKRPGVSQCKKANPDREVANPPSVAPRL